ncbi:MAG: sugar ABC transporter substrate-binding protein [Treponema sp.]
MKKIGVFLITLLLVPALMSAKAKTGKSQTSASSASVPKIGFPFLLTSDPTMRAIVRNVKYECEAAGCELVTESWDFTPDALVTATQKLINEGCDGLILAAPSISGIPALIKICTNSKVPFVIPWRHIVDPAVKKMLDECPYFVGNTQEDDEQTAYNLLKSMTQKAGVKNVAVLGLTKGDVSGDMRDHGMQRAADEFNVKILTETRNFSTAADATRTVEGFVAAYPDIDGIFITGGAMTQGILQGTVKALDMHKKQGKVKIGMIDYTSGMDEEIDKGYLYMACGGNMVADPLFSCAMLLNTVKGAPLSDKPLWLKINFINLTSAQSSRDYFKYVEGDVPPYSSDEMKSMFFKFTNPDVTADSFAKVVTDYSLENVMTRHAAK